MLIELLQTDYYTQQEHTYLPLILHQPIATNKCTIQKCYKQYKIVQTAK